MKIGDIYKFLRIVKTPVATGKSKRLTTNERRLIRNELRDYGFSWDSIKQVLDTNIKTQDFTKIDASSLNKIFLSVYF